MAITDPLVLPPDLVLAPVRQLDAAALAGVDHREDDWAVTRPQSRTLTRIVDAELAALLSRFRDRRTIVDAVVDYSRRAGRDPRQVLEEALPALQRFIGCRWLVPAGSATAASIEQTFLVGDRVAGCEIVAPVHLLEDTEVYQARHPEAGLVALKIARPGAGERIERSFRREAALLERLEGVPAPVLVTRGEHAGEPCLVMEWCAGAPVGVAAAELRRGDHPEAREELRRLALAVLEAYGHLHAQGVVHADVHPGNLLVSTDGRVRIVDFGLARVVRGGGDLSRARRGGVAEFQEPELAAARLAGEPRPAATEAGEQYSVAALLYRLFCGAAYLEPAAEKTRMLRQVVERPPLPFPRRGVAPWPAVERVLGRALAKEPGERYPSLAEMARELAAAPPAAAAGGAAPEGRGEAEATAPGGGGPAAAGGPADLPRLLERALLQLRPEGRLYREGPVGVPVASFTFGAAGCAYALFRLACLRREPALLAQADQWATRAARWAGRPDAFYSPRLEVTREKVGRVSLFHTDSGVHAVLALVAHARGDFVSFGEAVEGFVAACRRPCADPDLTVGRSSVLVGCALLTEALRGAPATTGREDEHRASLRALAGDTLSGVWEWAESQPSIAEAQDMRYTGIAHGWGGLCYAALLWCEAAGVAPPPALPRRLEELAELAEPHGRGVRWPVRVGGRRTGGALDYMASWCNGAPGLVHLWTAAARRYGERHYEGLAESAAWTAWEAHDHSGSVCCGAAGRAYALLNLYRHGGDAAWLRRARRLVADAAELTASDAAMPTSLYKGALGVALLAGELERPELARQPLFELHGC